jgi:hypothetical protein
MEDLTTKEQTDELLNYGVDKNSADFYYGNDNKIHHIDGSIPYSLLWASGCIPCWSVGKLIELYRSIPSDFHQMTFTEFAYDVDITKLLVERICSQIHSNKSMEEFRKKLEAEKTQRRKIKSNKTSRDVEVLSLSSKMFGEMIANENDDFMRMTDFLY